MLNTETMCHTTDSQCNRQGARCEMSSSPPHSHTTTNWPEEKIGRKRVGGGDLQGLESVTETEDILAGAMNSSRGPFGRATVPHPNDLSPSLPLLLSNSVQNEESSGARAQQQLALRCMALLGGASRHTSWSHGMKVLVHFCPTRKESFTTHQPQQGEGEKKQRGQHGRTHTHEHNTHAPTHTHTM